MASRKRLLKAETLMARRFSWQPGEGRASLAAMRLHDPRPTAPTVTITFEGQAVLAQQGETVAAALTAAGHLAFRRTPGGAPRGLHCGMGACWDCIVTIDGRPSQRACMTPAADGMTVGVTGGMAVGPGPAAAPPDPLPERVLTPGVLVVGGGPAGLSAAVSAWEAGADVLLLDERGGLGGQYYKPAAAPDLQARRGDRLRARAAGVPRLQAAVWGAFPGPELAAASAGARLVLRPRQLILAPGAHEAPVHLPGWTLPGCMTTGALQGLVRTHRVSPGTVVVAGNGPLNLQVAVELLRAGGQVAAVVEAAARPDGLALAAASPVLALRGLELLAALRRAGVPVLWGTRPVAVLGRDTVAGLRVAGPGGVAEIAADAVALNWGFQAETGLARALGAAHRVVAGRLETVTDAAGRTSVARVFAVGDGARMGGAQVALHRGRSAGLAAAAALGHPAPRPPGTARPGRARSGGALPVAVLTTVAPRQAAPPGATQPGATQPGKGTAWAASFKAVPSSSAVLPRAVLPRAARPRAVPPWAALRRAERFQRALWSAYAAPPPDPADLPDDAVVCRCEEVTAGALRGAMRDGAASPATLKRATRAGMGRCAGRFCGAALARLCGAAGEAGFAAPRLPLRPVPAGAILAEHPEPRDAVVTAPVPTRWTTAPPGPLPADAGVVVIGGGILGLATALFLARDGADVLVLDRGEPGMAASTANAGSLHVQLVPYVYAAGGGGPMAASLPLGPAGVALWRELARDAGEDLGLRTEGGLILAETAAELELLRAKAAFERSRGIPTEVVGVEELRGIAPGLDGRFAGAAFCPLEGQGDPLRGTAALLALARRAGVRVAAGLDVTGLQWDGAVWRVLTPAGPVRAGQVVNAAGVQAGRIAALAGVVLPMHALVQQVIATEAAPPLLRQLVAWTGRHLSLKQGDGGHLLLGGGWPGTQDAHGAAQVLRASVEGNLALACRALPALAGVNVLRAWTGLAPHLERGPVISGTPGQPGLWHGVTGNGYTLGPVVGRMLADAVLGRGGLPGVFGL